MDTATSKLACATHVFSLPGVRFMHKVRAANPKATVRVKHLPKGLKWNKQRQLVEGVVEKEGHYTYEAVIREGAKKTSETIYFDVSKDLQMPRPFMGWISWNSVQSEVSEEVVRRVADLFTEKGLKDCGWNTIVMDDWWHATERAADGRPQANAERFPHGVKAVGDYVHSRGLKFGIYTDVAEQTCAGAFGSLGYEAIDARQYAEWGVDIVKCDYCNAPTDVATAANRYKTLGDALKASGRNIALYICEWGEREPWRWGTAAGGTCWRVSYDVRDCWSGAVGGVGVVQSIEAMKHLSVWQGVNRWNDADMLCTGLHGTGKSSNDLCATGPGMTQDEYRTQFSLWCMWSSPMALSFDPRSGALTDDDLKIITNREMIALNQDPMGAQADLVSEADSLIVFAKDCENGDVAVSVTNMSDTESNLSLDLERMCGLSSKMRYAVRDLWEHKDLGITPTGIYLKVRPHATRVIRIHNLGKH